MKNFNCTFKDIREFKETETFREFSNIPVPKLLELGIDFTNDFEKYMNTYEFSHYEDGNDYFWYKYGDKQHQMTLDQIWYCEHNTLTKEVSLGLCEYKKLTIVPEILSVMNEDDNSMTIGDGENFWLSGLKCYDHRGYPYIKVIKRNYK